MPPDGGLTMELICCILCVLAFAMPYVLIWIKVSIDARANN